MESTSHAPPLLSPQAQIDALANALVRLLGDYNELSFYSTRVDSKQLSIKVEV